MDAEQLRTLVRIRAMFASGEALKIRQAARLTLAEVSDAIGVGTSTLFRWETDERRPNGEAALRYAALLDKLAAVIPTTEETT